MSLRTVDVLSDRELADLFAAEPELLAICDAITHTRPSPRRRPSRTKLALAAAVAVAALAAPALALTRVIVDFLTSPAAPRVVVLSVDMSRAAPKGMDPRAIATEARTVAQLQLEDGTVAPLFVAPTAAGGFCFQVSVWASAAAGGCDANRETPFAPGFVSLEFPKGPAVVYGDVLDHRVTAVELHRADGAAVLRLPLVRISSPIAASFFLGELRDPDSALPLQVTFLDEDGHTVASKTIPRPPG